MAKCDGLIEVKEYNEGIDDQEPQLYSERVCEAVAELAVIKRTEADLAKEKARCQMVIQEFHFNTGARNFRVPGIGNVVAYLGQRTSFKKPVMVKYLVEHGVVSTLIKNALAAAEEISVGEKVTVRFTPE